jgi:nitroreductase/NAD-dependent dihydropyrimidine dehydrogenase PreA subunit
MSQISVDTKLCKKDGACVAVCPAKIFSLNAEQYAEANDEALCIFCGQCIAVCSADAIAHTGLPDEPFFPAATEFPKPEMMDGFLKSRRSMRAFKPSPVSRETIASLLDVARRAPSAQNAQKLHWMVITDAAKIHALAEETVNWIRAAGIAPDKVKVWDSGWDFVLRDAPTLVLACAPSDYMWAKEDAAIALTYLELAAESRGLGACWAGYLTRISSVHAPLAQALALPEGYTLCGGLMLGEPKYKFRKVPPRKPLSVTWA